jgi:ATP-dependent helicase HrpB
MEKLGSEMKLPIWEIVEEVKSKLHQNNTLIVHAPPGAGKSTILPLVLKDEPFLEGKKILMLEPRRLATKSIAQRMSDLIGEKTGETVGYRIRFESQVSQQTRIEVLTEGILTRMLLQDNALEDVGLVIFDEFHERNLQADVAMALVRECQQVIRPDLRIMVMSATLDIAELSTLLDAPLVSSKGRQYPVAVRYTGDFDYYSMPEMVVQTIKETIKKEVGDILVFLPGQGEILHTAQMLRNSKLDLLVYPLYGQLSPLAQQQAIRPNTGGKRKVVLATSIAETSLTIEGVGIVIDTGYGRTSKFNPRSGLSRLETIRISKDAADQRAGRAGRLGPGICIRMWSLATQERLDEFRTPEILESDLAFLVLDLLAWGVTDIQQLTWLSEPPKGNVEHAKVVLEQLEAVKDNKLTPHGKQMHQIPAHPRISHMLVMASATKKVALAADIAAVLEEKDPLDGEPGVDINLRLEALRRARKENLHIKGLQKIEKISRQYRQLLKVEADNTFVDPYETGLLLAYAYPERIASARPGNNAQFQLANGKLAMMNHKDELAHESWLAIAHLDARDGMGKIFMASPINPRDLAPLVKSREVIQWDFKKGELLAQQQLSIGSIVLRTSPLQHADEASIQEALLTAIRADGNQLLDWNDSVVQMQNRILSLRTWNETENWPDVSTAGLLENPGEWLTPYLTGIRKKEHFRKLDLQKIILSFLDYNLQQKLDSLAPDAITVPTGSKVYIQYNQHGESPILPVRLQELFGMKETPKINSGKNTLLLHLLSPGYKPVQVTSDLMSFWTNTYFEVRKDLKRRYPKHFWPDNPLEAMPVRGIKRN